MEQARAAIAGGARVVQLRMKDAPAGAVLAALTAGTLVGQDHDFPFGPFRMYATRDDPNGTVVQAVVLARTSDDNGRSWSGPIDLTGASRDHADPTWRISVVGPGGMIQDRRGRLVAAMWR